MRLCVSDEQAKEFRRLLGALPVAVLEDMAFSRMLYDWITQINACEAARDILSGEQGNRGSGSTR